MVPKLSFTSHIWTKILFTTAMYNENQIWLYTVSEKGIDIVQNRHLYFLGTPQNFT